MTFNYRPSRMSHFISDVEQKSLPKSQLWYLGILYGSYRVLISFSLFLSTLTPLKISWGAPATVGSQSLLLFYTVCSIISLFVLALSKTRNKYGNQLAFGVTLDIIIIGSLLMLHDTFNYQMLIFLMVTVAMSFILLVSYQGVLITLFSVTFVIYQQFFYALKDQLTLSTIVEAVLISIGIIFTGFVSWFISKYLTKIKNIATNKALEVDKLNAITQEVIGNMQQGILVFDADKNIMVSNHASNILLNLDLVNHSNKPLSTSLEYLINNDRVNIDSIYTTNRLIEVAIYEQHRTLIEWIKDISLDKPSQMTYSLPKPTTKINKLRISTTPMQDGIIFVSIEDLQREQRNAQQLKLASLGQLTASIAHEIRNPLSAISQASQLLIDDGSVDNSNDIVPDPNIELYQMIFKQTKRVNQIIEDVLKLSRQAKPDQVKLDICEWIEAFIKNYYPEKDIFLYAHNRPILYFDPNQLEQILINLVNNGLRFCGKKHAHVFVEIEVFLDENDVILDVLDDGDGVPANKQENLFMPFFTTDNEGTGLGLYLSQAFAEANFASLIYVPNHKKTCFRLVIPQVVSEKE